jgi:hypothetical protein
VHHETWSLLPGERFHPYVVSAASAAPTHCGSGRICVCGSGSGSVCVCVSGSGTFKIVTDGSLEVVAHLHGHKISDVSGYMRERERERES